jgi:hypothetical protein
MRGVIFCLCLGLAAPIVASAQTTEGDMRGNLTRLHDELRLSAAQEAAWRQYEAAISPNAQADARRRAAEQMMGSLPTPRRIALMEANMASDAADFRHEGAAVIAFYNQLTADQQKTFDRVTLPAQQGIGEDR